MCPLVWSQTAPEKLDVCDNLQNSYLCPCKYEGVYDQAHESIQNIVSLLVELLRAPGGVINIIHFQPALFPPRALDSARLGPTAKPLI